MHITEFRQPGIRDYARMASTRGLLFAYRYFTECHQWDIRYQTQTALRVEPNSLGLPSELTKSAVVHTPSWTNVLRDQRESLLSGLSSEQFPHRLIDLGSGTGKVLLFWRADQDFTPGPIQLLGLELSPSLLAIAKRNWHIMFPENEHPFRRNDFLTLPFGGSPSNQTAYLYNPLHCTRFRDLATRLVTKVSRIIYTNPVCLEAFTSTGWEVVAQRKGKFAAESWVILSRSRSQR